MAKKIDLDLVIGNALIIMNKEQLTKRQIYYYINIVDRLLPEGYYTYGNNCFEDFCERYNFIVKKVDDTMIINNSNILERYFRIGLPIKLVKVLEKAALILNEIEAQNKLIDNYDQMIGAIKRTLEENDAVTEHGENFRMVQATGPVEVKIKKKSRDLC